MFSKFFNILIINSLPVFLIAQNTIQFQSVAWDSALIQAQQTNKLIFVDAFAPWCMPCKAMSKKVFTRDSVAKFYNSNFINIRIDTETPIGADFVRSYDIKAYPTYLFFNEKGILLHRASGSMPDTTFIQLAKEALQPNTQSETLYKRYLDGERNPDFMYQYAYTAYKNNNPIYSDIAESYLSVQSDWNNIATLRLIFDLIDNPKSGAYGYFLNHQKDFEKVASQDSIENKVLQAALYDMNLQIYEKQDSFDINKDVPFVFHKYFQPAKAQQYSEYFRLLFLANQGDWEQFFPLVKRYENQYIYYRKRGSNHVQRAQQYLDLAAMISINSNEKKHLQSALRLARSSVQLNPSYQNCYTVASYYYTLNEKKLAAKFMRRAFRRAKRVSEIDREFLAELEVFRYQVKHMKKK